MFSAMKTKAYTVLAVLLALVITGCETVPTGPAARGSSEMSNEAVQEAVAVQELRREVAELRDTVEVQRNELEKVQERQRQLYDDLDYRLRQGELGAAGQGGTTVRQPQSYGQTQQTYGQQQTGTGGQQSASGQQEGVVSRSGDEEVYGQQGVAQEGGQQQTRESSQQQQSAAIQQSTEPSRSRTSQSAVASAEEQSAYDSAFELLKQSRYNDAIIEFRSMIGQFPDGALVDDAQYWIGEAYYVTRDFESALGAFESVVNQYPDSQRVPEALLKLGYVQAELGRNEEARRTLNQVISQYPGSRVAISAETRLGKLQ